MAPAATGSDKTSILFTVRDEIGVLHRMLRPFARHHISLCGIESRPRRGKPWEYVFFLDLGGHRREAAVRRALAEPLCALTLSTRLLAALVSVRIHGAKLAPVVAQKLLRIVIMDNRKPVSRIAGFLRTKRFRAQQTERDHVCCKNC